jgi:hypothetical protein
MAGRWATLAVVMLVGIAAGQKPSPPPLPAERFPGSIQAEAHRQATLEARREHQQALRRDTERLLQLATSLKQEVERAPAGTISAASIRQSEEIEKIAKRLKKGLRAEQ